MSSDGPWWVVIDLHRPYSGGEIQQEPGVIRIPFATGESAGEITVSVRCIPAVVQGTVLDEEVSDEFRQQTAGLMERNDGLLRRLAD